MKKRKNTQRGGLRFKKLDLHTHTPASKCFTDHAVTPEQIIQEALAKGLAGIAITDHNSGDWIDMIKQAAAKTDLVVFPGVEITCMGGIGGIHVIALFDPDRGRADIEGLLGHLELKPEHYGNITTVIKKDPITVCKVIAERGGLAILAHANSSKGVLNDMQGQQRTQLIQSQYVSGVEATDFQNVEAKKKHKRVCDLLDGNDPVYRRKLAVYQASDNPTGVGDGQHGIAGLGIRCSHFKLDQINLEGLRQCLADPDVRIRHDFDYTSTAYPHISGLQVTGGFLDGLQATFHEGLNSIIGSTGTGKSLLIEFMRFLFGKLPQTASILGENRDKLEKQLRAGGIVTARFVDASGDEYEISRSLKSLKKVYDAPTTCRSCTSGEDFVGDVNSIFPLLIYSQNEILEIARDPQAQLKLLDNFRNFDGFRRQIDTMHAELRKLDQKFIDSYRESTNLTELKKQAATLREKIKKCEKTLKAKVPKEFAVFKTLDADRKNAKKRLAEFDQLLENLDELLEGLRVSSNRPPSQKGSIGARVAAEVAATKSVIQRQIEKTRIAVVDAYKRMEREIRLWERSNKLATVERKYHKALALKTKIEQVESERAELVEELESIGDKIESATNAVGILTAVRKDRIELLRQLRDTREKYFEERSAQAKLVTERSDDKLRIEITQAADSSSYRSNLLKVKVGSHAEEREIDSIIANLSVVDFVELVLDSDAVALAEAATLTESKAENIIAELLKTENLSTTLALQYESYPDDAIAIGYRKQNGQHYPLSTLSAGQKADALIMIALGDSQMPVIIDQPEDALDISSIWDDVCTRLRTNKHMRQFIFTTHNSSIAVSSDSDQFIVMDADAVKGWIDEVGSIDHKKMKDKVVGHLEGGYDSYDLKRRKYGL